MLYDVEQIAKLTKVSKVTIYRKFKLNEVKPFIIIKQGKSYVDEHGYHVITQLLNVITCETDKINSKGIEPEISLDKQELSHEVTSNNSVITELKSEIEFLQSLLENHASKSEIEFLHNQLKEKDKQLESKDKLLENMQILQLRQPQQQNILALEEHFQDLDNKLLDIKEQMSIRKEKNKNQEHKGIFSKIFKK